MRKMLPAALAALLAGSGAALAETAEFPWAEADFLVAYPDSSPEIFTQLDADGDGLLSEAEVLAGVELGVIEPMDG